MGPLCAVRVGSCVQVNTDKVKEKVLDPYRSKCQPVFLLYKVRQQRFQHGVVTQSWSLCCAAAAHAS